MKNINLVIIVVALTVFAVSNSVSLARVGVEYLTGQYENITDLNDPHVQTVARFAVFTYDQRFHGPFIFSSVLPGSQKQEVGRMNYTEGTYWHLYIDVFTTPEGGPIAAYETLVYEAQGGKMTLREFHKKWL